MAKLIPFITFCIFFAAATFAGCQKSATAPETVQQKSVTIAEKFIYPIGDSKSYTQAKDNIDDWYNAQDFGENNHLGEDWNKNSGGNTDCEQMVFAAANGMVVYAADAGPGWGKVVIISHTLKDGRNVQSLYGHLSEILDLQANDKVEMRNPVGRIGNANGRYPCHLHFEIRLDSCPAWNHPGPGYAGDQYGWVDPSDFIDSLH